MTPDECRAKYQQWLNDAMDAYNQLNVGGSVRVVVDQNGERGGQPPEPVGVYSAAAERN